MGASRLLWPSEFRQAENIAIRILKPGYFRAGGRCPDAGFVLVSETVLIELNTDSLKRTYGGGNIGNLPAEHRVRRRLPILDHADAQHRPVQIEHERKRQLVRDKTKSERAAVEFFRALCVAHNHKRHYIAG